MDFSASDGLCILLYLASISLSCMALACACVSGIFRKQKSVAWYKVFQGVLIGTMVLGFEIVLSPAYMSERLFNVFGFIFTVAQDAIIGLVVVLLPYFLSWIIARPWRRRQRCLFYPMGICYFGFGLAQRIVEIRAFAFVQTGLFVFVYLFCLVVLWKSLPEISDKNTRTICRTINIISLALLPLCVISFIFPVVEKFSYPTYMMAFSITMMVYYFKGFHIDQTRQNAKQSLTLENLSQWKITEREFGVIQLLTKGLTNKEIASQLNISVNTVNNHVANIFDKMDVRSRVDLLRLLQEGPWA